MIRGVGIDVVNVKRLVKWMRYPGLLKRYFHPEELQTALSRGGGAALSLAARFAAKEAFGKALGTGLAGIILKDILVVNSHNGRPELRLFNSALAALEKAGASHVHVSLTHERDNAQALVVLEAD
jgi:holo-[acyl-carrier protein] synthase